MRPAGVAALGLAVAAVPLVVLAPLLDRETAPERTPALTLCPLPGGPGGELAAGPLGPPSDAAGVVVVPGAAAGGTEVAVAPAVTISPLPATTVLAAGTTGAPGDPAATPGDPAGSPGEPGTAQPGQPGDPAGDPGTGQPGDPAGSTGTGQPGQPGGGVGTTAGGAAGATVPGGGPASIPGGPTGSTGPEAGPATTGPGDSPDDGEVATTASLPPTTEPLPPTTAPPPDDASSSPRQWLWLLLPALLAGLLAALLATRRRAGDGEADADPGDADPLLVPSGHRTGPALDLERRLRRAFRDGLRGLDRAGLVRYDPTVVSSRVARRLAQRTEPEGFVAAATVFDEVVYGRRDPTPADVTAVEDGFAAVLSGAPPP